MMLQCFGSKIMGGKEKYKLLIVDDNQKNCQVAKRCMEDCYEIEIAFDGEEALSQINRFNPAVVLLDIRMPKITGDDLVKIIKAGKPEIIVIMVSAHLTPELSKDCMQNGASACFNKPIDFDLLTETIDKFLKP